MYNLLIAIGLSLGALLVGYGLAGSLVAGILPAVVTFIAAYMYLARKSLAQLEAIMGRANDEMKVFQTMAPPTSLAEYNRLLALRTEKLQKTRDIMAAGFPLAKWQYLVAEQLHAQLGALDYMEQKYTNARPHLEKAWSRNWQSHAMLSCIDFREGNKDGAVARMEKLEGVASKEGVYWGLAVWLALEAGKRQGAAAPRQGSGGGAWQRAAEADGRGGAQRQSARCPRLRAHLVPLLPRAGAPAAGAGQPAAHRRAGGDDEALRGREAQVQAPHAAALGPRSCGSPGA